MAEELGEKTEEPTGKKLADARRKGKIAKSKDLSGAIDLIAATIVVLLLGSFIASRMGALMQRSLDAWTYGPATNMDILGASLRDAGSDMLWTLAPVMAIMFGAILISNFLQVGPLVTAEPLTPKVSKLNPISGFKRIFGMRGVMQTVMSLAKLSVVGFVVVLVMIRNEAKLVRLPMLMPTQALIVTLYVLLEILAWVLSILLIIGIIDYMYQRWQHKKDLRMTKQEVKDEVKSLEGDPEMKRRRMKIAQEVAMQRIGSEVPDADVVVTNPTHFSVALRYKNAWGAPRVVAKGADQLAFRIRHVASANGVPIIERPPLARALYWGTQEGDEISEEHYEAVAEILAYVYRLDGTAQEMRRNEAHPTGALAS